MSENNENMNPIEPDQPVTPQEPQEPVAPPQGFVPPQPNAGQLGVPQSGYVPPQGYPQGYAPQVAQPSPVVLALKDIPKALGHIWHGRTSDLFSVIFQQRLFALVTFGIYILTVAILGATALARSHFGPLAEGDYYGTMMGMWADHYSYFSLNFGQWFYALILFIVTSVLAILMRALAIMLTLKIRGITVQFMRALTLYAVACIPVLMLLPLVLILVLLPSSAFTAFMSLVIGVVIVIASIVGELLVYVGINREGRMAKSPVLPYASLTTAAIIISVILNVLIMQSF
ncbi:hypothetical protein [Arcanobacterium buesumense]|uniref:Yip1 domain-containing protein n=1 Tax=Arcanobacterium buesumense TaxID=2722751 RepID=A0A6H2ELI0_9ACTO|nr:hypothetical protein [Arcanobacterium buesumense]QJC21922.1 hypothetical protein HC352_04990 [Arcanobacterium buesumense]